jgi:hypothetical protein
MAAIFNTTIICFVLFSPHYIAVGNLVQKNVFCDPLGHGGGDPVLVGVVGSLGRRSQGSAFTLSNDASFFFFFFLLKDLYTGA